MWHAATQREAIGHEKMDAVAERLAKHVAEVENEVARLRKMLELVREIGDDGVATLVALCSVDDEAKGNVRGADRQHHTDGPRGREAIRQIVRERPGIWTLAELRSEMAQRGWLTTAKAVEVATKRLCEINQEGRRIGKGRYLFPADYEEEGTGGRERVSAMIAA